MPAITLSSGRTRCAGPLPYTLSAPFGPDGVRALEDPVLPRREAGEDLALERLGPGEAERRLHAGERVGREGGALLDGDAHLVVPVDVVGRERHEPGLGGGRGVEVLADAAA